MKEARPLLGGEIRLPRRVLVFRESFTFALGPRVALERIGAALGWDEYDIAIIDIQPILIFTAGSEKASFDLSKSPAEWLHYLEVAFTEESDGLIRVNLSLYVDPMEQLVLKKEKLYWDHYFICLKNSIITGNFNIEELDTVRIRAERQNILLSIWSGIILVLLLIAIFSSFPNIGMDPDPNDWSNEVTISLLCFSGFILILLPILWAKYVDKG